MVGNIGNTVDNIMVDSRGKIATMVATDRLDTISTRDERTRYRQRVC